MSDETRRRYVDELGPEFGEMFHVLWKARPQQWYGFTSERLYIYVR